MHIDVVIGTGGFGGSMFIKRDLEKKLKRYANFPVIALLGPRQSGKTTLTKKVFTKHKHISLENPETLQFVLQDPQGFLKEHENQHGLILDEFQRAPDLLSYIQLEVDEKKRPGYFVLTGSQNFLVNQAISQSLAGRVGILSLLPLSINELAQSKLLPDTANEMIFQGSYPRLYDEDFTPEELYSSYIRTYVERDVRLIVNVENLRLFQRFMQLCAGRIGQLLNISDIATNCGVTQKTIERWLSVLEASYIVFLMRPHHNNFNKRLTKSPKLYFYDTGLACSLLGIRSAKDLALHSSRSGLFESLILSDLYKQYCNIGVEPPVYFWRDKNGRIEVDGVFDLGIKLVPLEIKSGQTIIPSFFTGLKAWSSIAGTDDKDNYLIYGGDLVQKRSSGRIVGWKQSGTLVQDIEKEHRK